MIAYVLIQVEPGMARFVMNTLVESGLAARAAALTGDIDILARIEDVEWKDLSDRLLDDVQRIPGIRRTTTALAVSGEEVGLPWDVPIRVPWKRKMVALVFVKLAPGGMEAMAQNLYRSKRVLAAVALTGSYDMLIEIEGNSVEEIASTVTYDIHPVEGVVSTSTALLLAATKLPKKTPREERQTRS